MHNLEAFTAGQAWPRMEWWWWSRVHVGWESGWRIAQRWWWIISNNVWWWLMVVDNNKLQLYNYWLVVVNDGFGLWYLMVCDHRCIIWCFLQPQPLWRNGLITPTATPQRVAEERQQHSPPRTSRARWLCDLCGGFSWRPVTVMGVPKSGSKTLEKRKKKLGVLSWVSFQEFQKWIEPPVIRKTSTKNCASPHLSLPHIGSCLGLQRWTLTTLTSQPKLPWSTAGLHGAAKIREIHGGN